ncbi:ribonuclease H-like domain-containing protein [Tanacetum coccineum]
MSGSQDEIPPPPPPPSSSQTQPQQTPHIVSTIKLPILKNGEYDIWAMKMGHYLAYTDYPIWEVIQNRNGPVSITTDTQEDHLTKFHKMTDVKEMWDAIKSRFGGNDESKKMQKYILKQQFEGLSIHGARVSSEDANQKFLRSLPSAWSQVSLIMRTKPGVDSLSFDDLYNNLRVFENDVKGSTASSSSTQNVAFVSENTSSTNDVSTAYSVSNPSGQNSQYEQTSSYSLLANQSSCPQLDHEDLEQLDEFDLEEMDLKWQVAMISMRMKKFYKKTGRKLQFDAKEPVGFDKTKVECYNCHKTGHFARECRTKGNQDSRRRDAWNSGNKDGRRSGKQEDSKALVTIDGEGVDWTSHSEEEEDYALMACNSSGSDTEVTSCSNECKESYAKLKKLYDAQREQLSDASIEIKAYTQGLKKVEAQLVAHQQGQLWYEEKIRFMKIDLDDKTNVLTYHKKQKEKEDLKAKVEKWHNSSKNLGKLLNTQMSANDKFGLGYGDHRYDGILSYENEVLQSVFMSKESELENQPLYDSVETQEPLPEPTVNEPKVVSQPKVWSDAPIIEEYESDSEDEHVSLPTEEQETPSFANQQVKSPRETIKNQFTHSKNPTVDKKGLGYGFTARACFVCGSLSHLIRDCDFHEKRMAKQAELNNSMRKKSSQREIRPIWNNVQRVNHMNQFVPTAVLTRTGKIPVNTARASGTNNVSTARHNFNRQAVPTNAAMKVNTVKPIVNRVRPATVFYKTHSPFSRPFNNTTALRTNFTKQKVNTAEVNAVSAVGGKGKLLLSPQQVVIGDNKDTTGTKSPNTMVDQDYPHKTLQNKGIVDSGCSRYMTGNKAYLAEYQDFNGGPVAFGGSKGYINGKVLLRIPRQNNMYSFNLENIVPLGGLACLIAKSTIDESNKWHRREQLSDASIEIKAYTQGLKKVEAQLVAHQQGQRWYEEKTRYDGILSYENEVLQSVFMNKESELEKQPLYDRFVTAGGMHVVPPPMTGNYMPSGPDVEIDYSQFIYVQNSLNLVNLKPKPVDFCTCESDCSIETHESLPEPTVNEPKVVNQPKVWSDAPIIEEYESDSKDEHVSQPTKEQEQPSFASTNKQVKTPRETVKNQFTHSKNPTVDKKGLGYGFTARACFVCGSLSHLIRDCDFHEKRMAKRAELNNSMKMKSSQKEIRPIWNNMQRMNHKNQFVPTAAVLTNAAMKVNTVKPIVNRVRPANVNTAEVNAVSAVGGKRETAVKPSAEFKNRDIIEFCGSKGIKREYSNARTPQQNGVAERKNRTLIEAARTMLADSFLPNTFWAEAVSTACYVLNRVLVTKPQNKTPYELITGKIPIISYIRPFGCHVTILNTIDHLGKFEGKSDEGFLVGYSLNSKAFRVYNLETKRVEENLHINFLENKPNVAGKGPNWLFDLDYLTDSMNYQPEILKWKLTLLKTTLYCQYVLLILQQSRAHKQRAARATGTNTVNTVRTPVSTASSSGGPSYPDLTNYADQDDSQIPALEDIYDNPNDGIFTNASYDDECAVADFTNLESTMNVTPIPTLRIHSIHPTTQILGDPKLAVQTSSKVNKSSGAYAFVSYIQKQRRNNHKDFHNCLFSCFLSQIEPKKISEALEDENFPYGKKAIRTKWVYRNKKDERGVVVRNKARIEAIRIFLAFDSYMGFIVYQMDVKSAFLYGIIDEEVYVSQLLGFVDPKVDTEEEPLTRLFFIKKDKKDIMLVQDKYVAETLKKFDFDSVKTASTLIKTQKPLTKDEDAADVDVHLYRSMIGFLMYLTASRPDIMFVVYACSRFQVTPKTSHLNAVKRIFRYLKGKPKLGLWYPRVSSFDLEAYSDSDYPGANLDRKSTTREAEYVVAANCCRQVLWIQNQMLNYGFNFMNTKIYTDNESTICIVKNPIFHSKTKHIEIRHHFIRDAYEKKLIQVLKIPIDDNVVDLLTKSFDVSRKWTLDDMMMIWGSLYSFLRATYGVELVSAASLINTPRPKLSTARLGWCCSKVFNNGVDAWIRSKMQFGLALRVLNGN